MFEIKLPATSRSVVTQHLDRIRGLILDVDSSDSALITTSSLGSSDASVVICTHDPQRIIQRLRVEGFIDN